MLIAILVQLSIGSLVSLSSKPSSGKPAHITAIIHVRMEGKGIKGLLCENQVFLASTKFAELSVSIYGEHLFVPCFVVYANVLRLNL